MLFSFSGNLIFCLEFSVMSKNGLIRKITLISKIYKKFKNFKNLTNNCNTHIDQYLKK